MSISRRLFLASSSAFCILPNTSVGAMARELTWAELIPEGVPYGEIIGEGQMDEQQDIWLPVFDENATKLNPDINEIFVKIPGYIVPIDQTADGVSSFVLVPYVGACVHTPPPPPNQLIFVETAKPWKHDDLWAAVWVTGTISHGIRTTDVAETGYALKASYIEIYVWE